MAFPFKTGGDFYNCEAQRMRLHNLGANPTETATGLMYFNTGASNLGKHAVVHDGTNFKALAFVDEIATNAEFVELKEKVDLLIGDDVDTDTIIDSWKEVQAFLKDIEDTKTLQGMLSSYLPLSGGTIGSGLSNSFPLLISSTNAYTGLAFHTSGGMGYMRFQGGSTWSVTDAGWNNSYTLLHSGNITEVLDDLNNATGARFFAGTFQASNRPNMGVNYAAGLTIHDIAIDRRHQISFDNAGNLFARSQKSDGWYAWKTIAFTDSTVAAAQKLVDAKGNDAVTIDSVGNTFTANSLYVEGATVHTTDGNPVALFGTAYSALGKEDGAIMYAYGLKNLYFYTNGVQRMLINSSGNVIIGPSSYEEGRLRVVGKNGDTYVMSVCDYDGQTKFAVFNNGNVGIGTTDPKKKLHVVGDLYVDGNIIATKEVSAGGAGQKGESGDGGAEVIDKELAKGQSSYTIPNTIGRSAVAVSLYEWNANNGSWDMCLADISVKDATITVTFGSATSVNHKLVAVG